MGLGGLSSIACVQEKGRKFHYSRVMGKIQVVCSNNNITCEGSRGREKMVWNNYREGPFQGNDEKWITASLKAALTRVNE